MKAKTILLPGLLFFMMVWVGCAFEPRKMYSGPDQPKDRVAVIRQIDFLESRPIYLLDPALTGQAEVRVDNLGMVVLPGTYNFKGYLYKYRYQQSVRIVDATVYPGESSFPIERPVVRKVREEKPYMETEKVRLTVKPGFRYGLWCLEDGKIEVRIGSEE